MNTYLDLLAVVYYYSVDCCVNKTENSTMLYLKHRIKNLLTSFRYIVQINTLMACDVVQQHNILGPVVQSVVSLTSSLRIISLTVLADSIYNILIFFAEKM